MRRALRSAVGVLLAVGAIVPARSALAQAPAPWLRGQQTPVRKILYEENIVLSEGHNRLEEMKVELALLSDIATFPYYLGARAAGETLMLRGYVPNDWVRRRAEELARRNTFLSVRNELKIQLNLSTRPPLRPMMVLQKEGAELLLKNFNDVAGPMRIDARPNGLIVLGGAIDSVENKLVISRLFRQLSGCSGVVNELKVQMVLRDGQRVVQVTKDGSMVVPPSALGQEPEEAMASPPATVLPTPLPPTQPTPTVVAPPLRPEPIHPAPTTPTVVAPPPPPPLPQQLPPPPRTEPAMLPPPRPTLPAPTPLRSLDAQEGELRLPSALPAKRPSTLPAAVPEKVGNAANALTPPKLPMKWGHPAVSLGSQIKAADKLRTPPTPVETKTADAVLPTAVPPIEPVKPQAQARKDDGLPSKLPMKWGHPAMSLDSQLKAVDNPRTPPTPIETKKADAVLPTAVSPIEPVKPQVQARKDESLPGKLPMKWGHPAMSWESQMKAVEKLRTPPIPVETKKASAALPTAVSPIEPVKPQVQARKEEGLPTPIKPSRAKKNGRADFAEMHDAATPSMTWKRPGASEESEPKAPSPMKQADSPRAALPPPPPLPSKPSHRWPPAYETRPPDSPKGTPGVITFDDDPAPEPTPAPTPPKPVAVGPSRPIVLADLQRQVKSACGWPTREVNVQKRDDGEILVKVKVPNTKVEDQLTKKILAIPQMTAPKVRLLMDVGP